MKKLTSVCLLAISFFGCSKPGEEEGSSAQSGGGRGYSSAQCTGEAKNGDWDITYTLKYSAGTDITKYSNMVLYVRAMKCGEPDGRFGRRSCSTQESWGDWAMTNQNNGTYTNAKFTVKFNGPKSASFSHHGQIQTTAEMSCN